MFSNNNTINKMRADYEARVAQMDAEYAMAVNKMMAEHDAAVKEMTDEWEARREKWAQEKAQREEKQAQRDAEWAAYSAAFEEKVNKIMAEANSLRKEHLLRAICEQQLTLAANAAIAAIC